MYRQGTKIVNHHRHIARKINDAAAMWRTRGAPMAREVQRNDVMARRQGFYLMIPIGKVEADRMYKDDRAALSRAALHDVQV
ncbi:hypothetical protein PUN4_1120004 [Paraburkholderia unamae]|nr:hypothetical protein PUN4_1120004 [Paraburkholderia unamae]